MNATRAYLLVLMVFAVTASAEGQTVHLAPLPDATFNKDTILLRIVPPTVKTTSNILTRNGTSVRIADGRLYLLHDDAPIEIVELGDRTISELITQLSAKYSGVKFTSNFPEVSTSFLKEGLTTAANGQIGISGRRSSPLVAGLLGLGMSLNEVRRESTANRLLSNGGLHLDIVGTKQFDDASARIRIGFRSGEALTVSQSTEADSVAQDDTPTDASVTSIVEAAERINLGLHLDRTVARIEGDVLLGLGIEVAGNWSALTPFVFRDIPVGDSLVPVDSVFDEGVIGAARDRLDRVVPLWSMLVGVRAVFGGMGDYRFYAQADIGTSQEPVRSFGVRYTINRDSAGEVVSRTPIALLPVTGSHYEPVWRLGVGAKLANIIEMRVDAIGQPWIRQREVKPLLRILIGSNLTVTR